MCRSMIRLPALLLSLHLVLTTASAADMGPWKPVPLPAEAAAATLRGVFFLDERLGWIVGDKGLCLATTDGGVTWEKRETGSDATLRCVRFTDALTGFACGDGDSRAPAATGHVVMGRPQNRGTLLSTADGGKTWKRGWVPCNFEVWCVEASTAPRIQVGIGLDEHLDGDITRSDDGGANWTERRVFRALADIRAVTPTRWVAVGSPVSVGFTGKIEDPTYLAAECRSLWSDDAGKTWKVSKGSDGDDVLRALLVRQGLPLIAVGDAGAVLTSDDAGQTWRSLAPPARVQLRGIAAAGAADRQPTIVAVGDRGAIVSSADGGKTWRASGSGTDRPLHAVAACGPRLIAVGAGGTAMECVAEALAAARDLPPLPPAPVAAGGRDRPIPKATPEQRARVRVGDSTLVTHGMKAAAIGMNSEWQMRMSITAVKDDTATVVTELVKGKPPAGIRVPRRSEDEIPIAYLAANEPDLQAGETRADKEPADDEGKVQMKVTRTREPDETVEVGGAKLTCRVVKTAQELPGGQKLEAKEWRCPEQVPFGGIVKSESQMPIGIPGGGVAATMTVSQRLDEFTRGAN